MAGSLSNHINCINCIKKSVCRYKNNFTEYVNKIGEIDIEVKNMFTLTIKCNEFFEDRVTRKSIIGNNHDEILP